MIISRPFYIAPSLHDAFEGCFFAVRPGLSGSAWFDPSTGSSGKRGFSCSLAYIMTWICGNVKGNLSGCKIPCNINVGDAIGTILYRGTFVCY